jgi:hypothetical protein
MRQLRHPLSGAIYELDEDGHVVVTAKDGRTGTFDRDGVSLGGELRTADPELCRWVEGGPRAGRTSR